MSKSNKSKISITKLSIEDSIIMSRADSGIRKLSQRDHDRYLELKAVKEYEERRKAYNELFKLTPDKEEELKSYFYPSFNTAKNNKFGVIKGTQFKAKGIIYAIRSWGKTFIRSSENKVYKNEIIESIIL